MAELYKARKEVKRCEALLKSAGRNLRELDQRSTATLSKEDHRELKNAVRQAAKVYNVYGL